MTPRQANPLRAEASAAHDLAPDSGDLRVSRHTVHESGIPPARERLSASERDLAGAMDQLELALVESTRTEANLGLLLRGLKHLANGAGAAREANALLVQELESLRIRVAKVYEHEAVLEQRVALLEGALDAAAREHDAWLEEDDAFLATLLTEHEAERQELQRDHERKLAVLEEALLELGAHREVLRTEASRLTYERDTAVALLNDPVASTIRPPSPMPPPSSVKSSPPVGVFRPSRPSLKVKPEASSRPLIGYSVAADEVSQDTIEGAQPSSRPPKT